MGKKNKTILLIENGDTTALTEKLVLERYGYNVLTVTSGFKAIDVVLNNAIDLVLIDVDFDETGTGYESACEILARKNIPILFLTNHPDKEKREQTEGILHYGYVLKTVLEDVLISSIETALVLFETHENIRESGEDYRLLVEEINDIIFSLDEHGVYSYISPRIKEHVDFAPEDFIEKSFIEFVFPADRDYARRQFTSLKKGVASFGEARIIKKTGGVAWFRISGRPVFKSGKFSGVRGVFVDVTERKITDEQINVLLDEKEELLKELHCLYDLSKLMEETPDSLDEILCLAADMLAEFCNNIEYSVAKIVYRDSAFFSNEYAEPVISIESDIVIRGTTEGYILIGYTVSDISEEALSFNERDVNFLANASERIGRIIEIAKAREELKKLEREIIKISEIERRNIGHEIHDGLGQILTGISFMVKSLKKQIQTDPDGALKKTLEIGELVNDASRLCARIINGMPLLNIKHNTLLAALEELAIKTKEIFGVNCRVYASEDFFIQDDFVSLQLYRIIQEAVNNAVKHSGGDLITISLRGKSNIYLAIQDNGKGYNFSEHSSGMGLNIMKHRANLINGKFTAGNHEEGGFAISVLVL